MDHSKELTHLSLCTGYGGIDLGLKRVVNNVRTIAYSEIEAYACENLVAKMEKGWLDPAPIWTDLKTFPWSSFYGKVDILSGGFPCQPFSTAGERHGSEDPRHLWPHIKRGIEHLGRPPIIFLENVEGIISAKLKSSGWSDPIGTPVLKHVLSELERLDYTATAGIFSASEVNAPHQRKRVFILAISNKLSKQGYSEISKRFKSGDTQGQANPIKRYYDQEYKTAYPQFRGQPQYSWEAPRTIKTGSKVGNANNKGLEGALSKAQSTSKAQEFVTRSSTSEHISRPLESKMGGTIDGIADRMDSSKLFISYDNRTDELRLLGNGVIPDTARKAFCVLWEELAYAYL